MNALRILKKGSRCLGYLALVVHLAACASAQDLRQNQEELRALRSEFDAERARYQADNEALQQRLNESTSTVTRNSADYGLQIDRIVERLTRLEGISEENQRAVIELREHLGKGGSVSGDSSQSSVSTQPVAPTSADELFSTANIKLAEGSHQDARRYFRAFIEKYPKDSRASAAQYGLGESYYAEAKFGPAIEEYRKILENYRMSEQTPDALYKVGSSLYQLKWCSDAEIALQELTKNHALHARARDAKKLLDLIQKYRSNKRFCIS